MSEIEHSATTVMTDTADHKTAVSKISLIVVAGIVSCIGETPSLVTTRFYLVSWRKQAIAQACAFSSPFLLSMSAIGIYHQLTSQNAVRGSALPELPEVNVWRQP
jgi:hypothetical protein